MKHSNNYKTFAATGSNEIDYLKLVRVGSAAKSIDGVINLRHQTTDQMMMSSFKAVTNNED